MLNFRHIEISVRVSCKLGIDQGLEEDKSEERGFNKQ